MPSSSYLVEVTSVPHLFPFITRILLILQHIREDPQSKNTPPSSPRRITLILFPSNQMVTRAYFDHDGQTFRRDSSRGHGYPLSHDRDLPPAPSPYNTAREHHLSNHETRSSNSAADQENHNSRPRSRIPVAVSRSIASRFRS